MPETNEELAAWCLELGYCPCLAESCPCEGACLEAAEGEGPCKRCAEHREAGA